ncbi:hypothetical protein RJT34_12645 [Clitoria ternatea]|uniref:Uncharacterized protein n=1 Tax=Clitoria ternatea TaxID=43366 RepID=A0AAN9JM36_CLITE
MKHRESEGLFGFGCYWREVDDLHAIVPQFHDANCKVIEIVGRSKGANVSLLYASKYHDVKTIVDAALIATARALFTKGLGLENVCLSN